MRHRNIPLRTALLALTLANPHRPFDNGTGGDNGGGDGTGSGGTAGDDKGDAGDKGKSDAGGEKKDPPWKDEKDFNPNRAWDTITTQREEAKRLREERDALAERIRKADEKDMTAKDIAERSAKERGEKLAETQAENARLKAAIKYHLDDDDLELLEDIPADKVEDRAKKIADRRDAASGKGTAQRKPRERLRGTNDDPGDVEETDPKKLAAAIPIH